MTENPIRTERRGHVLEVTLDRPKANAIDSETSRIMGEVFTEFRDDPELRVATITGGGTKFFCAGWDLKAAASAIPAVGRLARPGPPCYGLHRCRARHVVPSRARWCGHELQTWRLIRRGGWGYRSFRFPF